MSELQDGIPPIWRTTRLLQSRSVSPARTGQARTGARREPVAPDTPEMACSPLDMLMQERKWNICTHDLTFHGLGPQPAPLPPLVAHICPPDHVTSQHVRDRDRSSTSHMCFFGSICVC